MISNFRRESRASNSFDALRLIGAVIVLAGHASIITGGKPLWIGGVAFHSTGVLIFFAISGYLITQSWQSDASVHRFAIRRFLRLWPGLLFALLGTAIVIGGALTPLSLARYLGQRGVYEYIIRNLFLVTSWKIPNTVDRAPVIHFNGSLWTLAIEVGMYCTVPFICMIAKRNINSAIAACLTAIFGLIALRATIPNAVEFSVKGVNVGWSLNVAPYFIAGTLLQLMQISEWSKKASSLTFLVAFVIFVLWVVLPIPATPREALGVASIPYLVLVIGISPTLKSKVLERFGDVSYGVYLWAFPIQQLVFRMAGGGAVRNIAIALPLTIAVAWASWHFIEKPALRLKPSRRRAPLDDHGVMPATGLSRG